ncbi:MAG: phosphatidylserine decarboxylase, partial [Flavobacteriales bacterium]
VETVLVGEPEESLEREKRKFKEDLSPKSLRVWPCEGLLCDQGWIGKMEGVTVKGHYRSPRTIFGKLGEQIPDGYYFANIFLHNNDYHRIHSPIRARIKETEHLPGELVVLRPWIYRDAPSLPAFRNERMNLLLQVENENEPWFLSIVGGPAVGSIQLKEKVKEKGSVECGEELGTFLLGSTLCLAAPLKDHPLKVGSRVTPGLPI